MSKLKVDDYTVTTIDIYLNNDNPHPTREMVDFLAKKYDLMVGFSEEPYEAINVASGSTLFPAPPESELAEENRRLREDYHSLVHSQADLQGIAGKVLLVRVLKIVLLVLVLFCAVQIWRIMQ